MESKIRRSRSVDRVMTVIFYLVAIFFFALLIGFAGKVIVGGLMGAKPEMFRFARKGSIGNQLFNTIYLLTSLPPPMTDRVDLALHCSVLENLAPAKVATNQRVATSIISGVPP